MSIALNSCLDDALYAYAYICVAIEDRALQLPKPYHITKSERYETSCVSKRQK